MHDIAVLGVFEESLFLKIENFSVLRNRLGERLRGLGHWTCSTYAPVLPQLLHAAVDFADALDGELPVDHVEGIGRIGDDAGETARGDNGARILSASCR